MSRSADGPGTLGVVPSLDDHNLQRKRKCRGYSETGQPKPAGTSRSDGGEELFELDRAMAAVQTRRGSLPLLRSSAA